MEVAVIVGFLILILDIWVVWRIFHSSAGHWGKTIWIAVVILLPVFAHVAWYIAGPGRAE